MEPLLFFFQIFFQHSISPFPPPFYAVREHIKALTPPLFLCTQCKRRKPKTDLWMLKIEGGKARWVECGFGASHAFFFLLLHNPRIAGKLHKIIKPSLSPLDISLSSPRNLGIQTSSFRTPKKRREGNCCAHYFERSERKNYSFGSSCYPPSVQL